MTSLLLPHSSSSVTDSLTSLNLLCHSKPDARFMQDGRKAVWSIPYVSVAFFSKFKQNYIAYHSSKVSYCIFEIHQLWQLGFSRVFSDCCCRCSFEAEIIKIGRSSHKIYINNIVNFQGSTTILNAHTKKCLKIYRVPLLYTIAEKDEDSFKFHLYFRILMTILWQGKFSWTWRNVSRFPEKALKCI